MTLKLSTAAARRLGADVPAPKRRKRGGPAAVVSAAEEQLAAQMDAVGIAYLRQLRFKPPRKWSLDFFIGTDFGSGMVAVEVNGGVWLDKSGHKGVGQTRDYAKWSAAALAGIRIIHVTPADVASGQALRLIEEAVG